MLNPLRFLPWSLPWLARSLSDAGVVMKPRRTAVEALLLEVVMLAEARAREEPRVTPDPEGWMLATMVPPARVEMLLQTSRRTSLWTSFLMWTPRRTRLPM